MTQSSLSPIELSILLCLSTTDRHGYEIMKEMERSSGGLQKVGPGTLYVAIKRLLQAQLISEITTERTSRRRYYHLTDEGRRAVASGLSGYTQMLSWARREGWAV